MEDTTTLNLRRMQHYLAAYALIETVIGLAVAGAQAISRAFAALAERQRRARARLELQRLSDHMLRDIGLERDQIDRLFRS